MDMNYSELVIILDRSGSMESIRKDMEGGLSSFFDAQKQHPGRCAVTLVQFDDEYDVVWSGMPLSDVGRASIEPRGMTALLDALGKTINTVGQRLAVTPEHERPGRVLFLIITDGQENASKEFKLAQVREMIERQRQTYSWEFVYLGANQDAFAEGAKLGVGFSAGYAASAAGVRSLVADLSEDVLKYRSGKGYN